MDSLSCECRQADQDELRRLKIASHVYDSWTERGTRIAQLADRSGPCAPCDCSHCGVLDCNSNSYCMYMTRH